MGKKELNRPPEIPTSAGVGLKLGDVRMHDEIAEGADQFQKIGPLIKKFENSD